MAPGMKAGDLPPQLKQLELSEDTARAQQGVVQQKAAVAHHEDQGTRRVLSRKGDETTVQ